MNELVEGYLAIIDEKLDEHNEYNANNEYSPDYNRGMVNEIITDNVNKQLMNVTSENMERTITATINNINDEMNHSMIMTNENSTMDSRLLPSKNNNYIRSLMRKVLSKIGGSRGRKSRRSRRNKSRRNKSRRNKSRRHRR